MDFRFSLFILVFAATMLQFGNVIAQPGKLDSLLEALDVEKDSVEKVNTLNNITYHYLQSGEEEKAFEYGTRAQALSKKIDFTKGLGFALNNLGTSSLKQNRYPQALEYYLGSLRISKTLVDKPTEALILNNIGVLYSKQNNYPEALNYALKSLEAKLELENQNGVLASYTNIGQIYLIQKNYTLSLEYFQKALEIAKRIDHEPAKGLIYSNLGSTHLEKRNFKTAFNFFRQSLDILERQADPNAAIFGHNNIADLFFDLATTSPDTLAEFIGPSKSKSYSEIASDSARFHFTKALELNNLSGSKSIPFHSLFGLGRLCQREGKYRKAIDYYHQAKDFVNDKNTLSELNMQLANCWQQIGQCKMDGYKKPKCQKAQGISESAAACFKKAITFKMQYETIKDSILGKETEMQIALLRVEYETREKEKRITLLNLEVELKGRQLSKQRNGFVFSILGAIVLLILLGLVIRNMRISAKNTELNQDLLHQEKKYLNKTIENFAIRIVEKNSFIEELKVQLSQPEIQKKELLTAINQNLFIDNDLKSLELQIDKHHRGFMNRLNSLHPDLSKTEKRLSSLLVLGLSSKEIATLLHIETESVKKGRNRLRKKLNLEVNEDLGKFLANV